MRRPPAVVEVSTLVIDALPWARVTAVVGEDGRPVSLPQMASTPLSLSLPLGAYRVSLEGPPPASETRQLQVQVEAGRVIVAPIQQFPLVTAEDYFERYITSSTPSEATP
jgi:hypothetical protein